MKKPILITGRLGKSILANAITNISKKSYQHHVLDYNNLESIFDTLLSQTMYDIYIFEYITSFSPIILLENFINQHNLSDLNRIYIVQDKSFLVHVDTEFNIKIEDYFNWIPLEEYSKAKEIKKIGYLTPDNKPNVSFRLTSNKPAEYFKKYWVQRNETF